MKRQLYRIRTKALLFLLQAAAVGGIILCLANIAFLMEDSYSLSELSRSYEESDLFFRQVDTVISHKIRGQDNSYLLEENGEFSPDKEIDIQSYEETGNTVRDMNTTYRLGDLLQFYEDGSWRALHGALESVSGSSTQEAGEILDAQAETLETITPVTGISLAECSRWYSDSAAYLTAVYEQLDEVCADIHDRYLEYTTEQDESWSAAAPSNLLYCIENTSTGELYTNIDADSYQAAVAAAGREEDYESLYEGERSFNIMVTNAENVLNAEAGEWFLQERFLGTNEKVYLAVNSAYPVSDELQTWADYYARRETIVRNAGIGSALFAVLLLVCFALSVNGAGRRAADAKLHLLRFDQIPTELALGIYLIVAILFVLIWFRRRWLSDNIFGQERLLIAAAGIAAWLIFVSGALSFVRRWRAHTLWSNSITYMLLNTWGRIDSSRAAARRLFLFYLAVFALNFLFLLLFGWGGLVLTILLDVSVLLFLLRDMAGRQTIYEGIHQISKGDLMYRLDTTALQGETLEMAKAINEMGEGLSEAVEAIVKNERLKSELITNVSHDLKTPLTSIVNYVDLLKRENLQDPRARQYIEILDQKSQRLKQLTEDLVEASKISSGNVELDMERLELQSMLMQACGEFEERFEQRGLRIVWDMEREPVFIITDGRQLWRILENLLGNIFKYAQSETEVQVQLRRDGAEALIVLENSSREEITVEADELTGRFVRGDKSRSSEGSGLGLSIAQNLAELMDGKFELRIEGKRFIVRLRFPLAEEEPPLV